MIRTAFGKMTIPIIDIIIIVFMKIIANIDIIPSVIIQIRHGNTQSISEAALINAGVARYVCKPARGANIVSVQVGFLRWNRISCDYWYQQYSDSDDGI